MNKKEAISYLTFHNDLPVGWKYSKTQLCFTKGKQTISKLEVEKERGDHTCAVCGSGPDPDIRWFRLGCFYDLSEVSSKLILSKDTGLYMMPFCKACRAHFLFEILAPWIENKGSKQDSHYAGNGGNYAVELPVEPSREDK